MKNIKRIIALLLALIMAVGLISCDGDNVEPEKKAKLGTKVGDLCYSYDLELLLEEGTVNIEDHRGKVVVLNFWGTWCGPCKSELPHFDEVASEMADEVTVIAVHSVSAGRYTPEVYDVSEKHKNSKIIFAEDVAMGSGLDMYYNLVGAKTYYPYTLVLDADGIITYSSSGGLNKAQLVTLIENAKK